ncbi:hypothetical protein A7Q01_05970 [Eikenella sp. NML96-A-049]|uniref:lipopolysaccharide assembly protein LapA domain-containing protein n=1 Tax=unclassified Eikenella TaxID=2639367 RepID=UPI0007DEE587|nr:MULTISPECIES: lipopolysaccharide assembly protein LapA domain-containing protein [unclassified Eikenella]OAM34257.1 hypothetical protein A7P97_03310 [Eikenella sp. NML070372]OAM39003.1 hypothetical protein A7Q01_05970 [Eikenella sp. NML96-A-049]VDH00749.1 Uncharacterized integral membrane protein [Helicobacter pametensis]
MKLFSLIIKLLLLAIFIVLAAFNTHLVSFSYLPGSEISLPLILLLLAFFVIGAVFGVFSMFGRLLSLRHENNRLRNEVRKNARIAQEQLQTPAPADAAQPVPDAAPVKE